MTLPPLTGPSGLYTVSAMPNFLVDSNRVGWAGAFFADIRGEFEGSVDHVHTRLCIRRMLTSESRRHHTDKRWEIIPPCLEVSQQGDEERYSWRGSGSGQFLFIEDALIEQITGAIPNRLTVPSLVNSTATCLPALLIDALLVDLQGGSPAGPLVGDSIIVALLSSLIGGSPSRDGPFKAGGHKRLLELIDARFNERLGLDELAQAAGLSVRQFTRTFRMEMGCSPHQYILQRRIAHAKLLIRQGMPLAEVALCCGFSDQSQLTRMFTRHCGVTPGDFRVLG